VERLRQRLETAQQALRTLSEILSGQAATDVVRDAAIQRFEYTFEAMWKAAQLFLRVVEGFEVGSPKAVIRTSLQVGLLDADQTRLALQMADDRNLTIHTYNETVAEEIFAHIPAYSRLIADWLQSMRDRINLI